MKVILTEKVTALGSAGEIVNVSQGYGRNFLIPGRKAVLADVSNQKQLDHHKRALNKKIEEEKAEATALKSKVDGLSLNLIKKVGSNGKIFGSVTTNDLSKELAKQGIEIERRLILIEDAIKNVGTFDVKVKLHLGVEADFKVTVEMDPKQVEEEKKRQEAAEARAAKKAEGGDEVEAEAEAEEEKAVELTEEQKLQKEADRLLRSF